MGNARGQRLLPAVPHEGSGEQVPEVRGGHQRSSTIPDAVGTLVREMLHLQQLPSPIGQEREDLRNHWRRPVVLRTLRRVVPESKVRLRDESPGRVIEIDDRGDRCVPLFAVSAMRVFSLRLDARLVFRVWLWARHVECDVANVKR